MIDTKKIADALRRLAKYEIPAHPFTSRQLNGILTDIANELDPPEPKPEPLPMASTHDGLGNKFVRDCLKPNEHPIIAGYNRLDYVPVEGIRVPEPEPKPLLADAKAGDLCQRRDGKYVQVESYSNDRPCPVMCKSDIGGQDCFTLDGRNHNAINDSKDIIATEPLATEGTAEWAWQMLMLQKPVSHPAEGEFQDTYYTKEGFVRCMAKTGWQLYAEPARFKVGDWVKYDIDTYLRVIEPSGAVYKDKTLCKTLLGEIVGDGYPYTSCLTKASPSEVIVKIGCLKGTVAHSSSSHFCLCAEDNWTMIAFDMLDTPTRELVESLLKAQGGAE